MSRSGNYNMLTQAQQTLKKEGNDSNNISALHRMTGLSRDTVRKYLKDGVQRHGNSEKRKGSKLDPYKGLLQEQFELGNFNSESLFSLLQNQGYLGKKSILKEYIKKFRPKPTTTNIPIQTMRFETEIGEQLQMDWGFSSYVVEGRKKEHKTACLVMILGYSRQRYVEFFSSARQENLFAGMIHGFQYFGGIPKNVLTDNMKSVVQSRNRSVIVLNVRYEQFQAEMGFSTKLCKVRTPQTKGKAERLVHYVKNNFFPGRKFVNLVDLNCQALQWCNDVNSKEHGTTGMIPNEVLTEERKYLRALPPSSVIFPYVTLKRCVNEGMISFDGCQFGIPYTCNEKSVFVCREYNHVLIIDSHGEIIADHEIVGLRKQYWHKNQWQLNYWRNNYGGQKHYGNAVQVKNSQMPLFESTDFSQYDEPFSRRNK